MRECPSVRCRGELHVGATGTDAAGNAVTLHECDLCHRIVEETTPIDHPALFETEGTA